MVVAEPDIAAADNLAQAQHILADSLHTVVDMAADKKAVPLLPLACCLLTAPAMKSRP